MSIYLTVGSRQIVDKSTPVAFSQDAGRCVLMSSAQSS
ncbi:Unknown protein sequence [Pseudomonas coronafaciens pv. oryzae]|nr:Unknown protein sequence [Pseudomonas coronafaciens pv. oryzae]